MTPKSAVTEMVPETVSKINGFSGEIPQFQVKPLCGLSKMKYLAEQKFHFFRNPVESHRSKSFISKTASIVMSFTALYYLRN